eukprot:scaffold100203_cov28-Tisochrysis_lutea.AAC.2
MCRRTAHGWHALVEGARLFRLTRTDGATAPIRPLGSGSQLPGLFELAPPTTRMTPHTTKRPPSLRRVHPWLSVRLRGVDHRRLAELAGSTRS